ncbi:aminotransferase class V-fold PLP-dependent enzyme [Chitinophaga silvatica]|uniref:Aminotransferase class V-fold PLP-dependent enzyme n=1 Tax=Chitinophaga silvatica TaxID=2282649 RepID=A0A3E1YDY3_9BACT|nr:aminotransferase class V-fold PLP-dependent enzyme [Chitinophaga silvatica]RFS24709.1 aminotransferase class V-fold PLP-dependent enzyme [Chitinophaga silvatica]
MLTKNLETYFSTYRKDIIGNNKHFESPYGNKRIIYADWTATARAYAPIEGFIQDEILPIIGNTHTGTTITGRAMSDAYETAKTIIKQHVNAGNDDMLLFCGSGMTSAVNKLQRILGYLRPVVFITAMEHHSNHISWLETGAIVEMIDLDKEGLPDMTHFQWLLEKYRMHKCKIAAVTACSNVTGIQTPYYEIARLIHRYNGLCFVDFACSAPYCEIDMHPPAPGMHLDAIYFSCHKFLGGPATPGVLIFNRQLYTNKVPDQPGGGTVKYTNPWGGRVYVDDIEQREDGGTPPFIQGIKAGMCIRLKEAMGVTNILQREEELLAIIFSRLTGIEKVEILQQNITQRLGIVSFIVTGVHYNLIVRLLNDRFGIQLRGGCSCAGTYGHKLLNVDRAHSYSILEAIQVGDLSSKPGWIRLSVHPTMTNAEIHFILDALEITIENIQEWEKDYYYDRYTNEYYYKNTIDGIRILDWFKVKNWKSE